MEEEFYYQETGNKKKYLRLFLLLVVLIGIGIFCYKRYIFNPKDKVVYEVGDKISYDVSSYVKNSILDKDKYKLIIDEHLKIEDDIITKAGNYTFTIKYNNTTKKVNVEVKDTKAPIGVDIQDLTVGLDEEFEPDEFVSNCTEYSKPCVASFKKDSDNELYKKEGTHKVTIIVKDLYDNSVTKEAKLTVKKGYSLADEKKKDLTIYRLSHDYGDWDKKTYVVKYNKAFDANEIDNTKLSYLYDMTSDDINNYLPSGYAGAEIEDGEVIYVYNKYNYVIGFAYRAQLKDGRVVYLTNGE